MTREEVKEQLEALLDELPGDKVQLLLDFAAFLKQQAQTDERLLQPPMPEAEWNDWDRAIIAAEEYWFSLPEATRHAYIGKTVAVIEGRILDADSDPEALTARIEAQYPDQPVLYVEGEAERLRPLVVLSPRLR